MEFEELLTAGRRASGASIMAEGIAMQRFAESILPPDVRIFFDPYAAGFVDPEKIAWAREHPAEAAKVAETIERNMPGWSNAIRGRIRYFDDVVTDAPARGFTQIVSIGAGYDTRAYRTGTLKESVKIFEIDRPGTIARKIGIIRSIFQDLPAHVSFIPLDMAQDACWGPLARAGWDRKEKTLFLIEGLVMYLPRPAVEALLAEIAQHAGAGSAVLFDFVPQSLADGSSDAEGGQKIREWTVRIGEPILSGFAPGEVEPFLAGLGYGGVTVVPSRDFSRMYFTGKNAGRKVSGLMSIAYAAIPGREEHGP